MASIGDNTSIIQAMNTVVRPWADTTERILKDSLIKNKIGSTGILESSITYDFASASESSPEAIYMLNMEQSGRLIDMGVGRSHPLGSSVSRNTQSITSIGRKRKRWYAKTIYKRIYGALIRSLIVNQRQAIVHSATNELTQ